MSASYSATRWRCIAVPAAQRGCVTGCEHPGYARLQRCRFVHQFDDAGTFSLRFGPSSEIVRPCLTYACWSNQVIRTYNSLMNTSIPPFPCCFCTEPVLGLFGQDDFLDTVNLAEEPDDSEVIQRELFGPVHLSCLAQSGWGPFWYRRRLDALLLSGRAQTAFQDESTTIVAQPVFGELVIAAADGRFLHVDTRQISGRQKLGDSWFLPVFHDLTISLKEISNYNNQILRDWQFSGASSLLSLIDALGIRTRLTRIEPIEKGVLMPIPERDMHTLDLPETVILESRISYGICITDMEINRLLSVACQQ